MTEYLSNITCPSGTNAIGGDNFDDTWVINTLNVLSSGTSLASNATRTVDISSYIPDSNYDYKIIIEGVATTGSTSGNNARLTVTPDGGQARELGGCITRANSTQQATNVATAIVLANKHSLTFKNIAGQTGTFGAWLRGYRRIGKNGTGNNYISNVSIPSKVKVPNALVYGNPTINNGVVSNFNDTNYLDIPIPITTLLPNIADTAEIVIKFYIPSSSTSNTQDILSMEPVFVLEQTNNQLITYDFGTSENKFITSAYPSDFWIKLQLTRLTNGIQKTYSYSTDGENYTQSSSADFLDTGVDLSNSICPLRIGNHSRNDLLSTRAFSGSVDLNETHISVNGERIWNGMAYIKRLPVGGDNFDGQFKDGATLGTGISLAQNASRTFDISSYIPNDGCAYEASFKLQGSTGTTSGNSIQLRLGTSSSSGSNPRACSVITRTNSSMSIGGMAYVIIPANTRTLYLFNTGNAATNINVYLQGFCRLGKNNISNIYIKNIAIPNNTLSFGGNFASEQWEYKYLRVFSSATFNDTTSGATHSYTVSDYLPTNSEWYEILCDSVATTGNTSGNLVNINVECNPSLMNSCPFGMINTRTASTNYTTQNPIIIGRQDRLGKLNIRIYNYSTTNKATGNCWLSLVAYRRLGTNE